MAYDDLHEVSDQPSGNRTLDAATLRDLRREAAGLECPESGTFLTVREDGRVIATGQSGTRIPEILTRLAEKHDLTFDGRRILHWTVKNGISAFAANEIGSTTNRGMNFKVFPAQA